MTRMALGLDRQCALAGLPAPVPEFRFHPVRKWRIDWAFPDRKLGIEINGAIYVNGRHTRGVGVEKDMEKLAEAACLGWTILQVSPRHVRDGQALQWIERLT
jgi:very-short-patch-repair endonuclease